MSRSLICIVCPIGCQLFLDDEEKVSGNLCNRGLNFAISEILHPCRIVTTTIKIEGAIHPRLPIVSSQPVPKSHLIEFVKQAQTLEVKAPVNCGEVLLSNVLDLGVDILATRTMEKVE